MQLVKMNKYFSDNQSLSNIHMRKCECLSIFSRTYSYLPNLYIYIYVHFTNSFSQQIQCHGSILTRSY